MVEETIMYIIMAISMAACSRVTGGDYVATMELATVV
jgi:hypothetical protein